MIPHCWLVRLLRCIAVRECGIVISSVYYLPVVILPVIGYFRICPLLHNLKCLSSLMTTFSYPHCYAPQLVMPQPVMQPPQSQIMFPQSLACPPSHFHLVKPQLLMPQTVMPPPVPFSWEPFHVISPLCKAPPCNDPSMSIK